MKVEMLCKAGQWTVRFDAIRCDAIPFDSIFSIGDWKEGVDSLPLASFQWDVTCAVFKWFNYYARLYTSSTADSYIMTLVYISWSVGPDAVLVYKCVCVCLSQKTRKLMFRSSWRAYSLSVWSTGPGADAECLLPLLPPLLPPEEAADRELSLAKGCTKPPPLE